MSRNGNGGNGNGNGRDWPFPNHFHFHFQAISISKHGFQNFPHRNSFDIFSIANRLSFARNVDSCLFRVVGCILGGRLRCQIVEVEMEMEMVWKWKWKYWKWKWFCGNGNGNGPNRPSFPFLDI